MMFKHGFVHCDPHAANLLVRPVPSKGRLFGNPLCYVERFFCIDIIQVIPLAQYEYHILCALANIGSKFPFKHVYINTHPHKINTTFKAYLGNFFPSFSSFLSSQAIIDLILCFM